MPGRHSLLVAHLRAPTKSAAKVNIKMSRAACEPRRVQSIPAVSSDGYPNRVDKRGRPSVRCHTSSYQSRKRNTSMTSRGFNASNPIERARCSQGSRRAGDGSQDMIPVWHRKNKQIPLVIGNSRVASANQQSGTEVRIGATFSVRYNNICESSFQKCSEWMCRRCTFLNSPSLQECDLCFTTRDFPLQDPLLTFELSSYRKGFSELEDLNFPRATSKEKGFTLGPTLDCAYAEKKSKRERKFNDSENVTKINLKYLASMFTSKNATASNHNDGKRKRPSLVLGPPPDELLSNIQKPTQMKPVRSAPLSSTSGFDSRPPKRLRLQAIPLDGRISSAIPARLINFSHTNESSSSCPMFPGASVK